MERKNHIVKGTMQDFYQVKITIMNCNWEEEEVE